MFSQNSLGIVYYISINKGRPGRGAPRTPRGKQRKRGHDICIWKGQNKCFPCWCHQQTEWKHTHRVQCCHLTGTILKNWPVCFVYKPNSLWRWVQLKSGLLDKVYNPEFSRNLAGFSFHLASLQSSCVFCFLAKSVSLFSMDSLSRGVRKRNWPSLQGFCAELGIKFIFGKHRPLHGIMIIAIWSKVTL